MATVKPTLNELERGYRAALQEYLAHGGESSLQKGYELGRAALAQGHGVLEMIALHDRIAAPMLFQSGGLGNAAENFERANEFFTEAMSPFEMTHRAFGEGNVALRHLNETLESEAKRIAHALHDEAGQLLASVHLQLNGIAQELPIQLRERVQQVRLLLDEIEGQLRRLSHELRPTILDDLGLVAALEFLAEGVKQRTGFHISVETSEVKRLPASVETALYRVVQEALNNAAKHSRASHVVIKLSRSPNLICCSVRDDGVGFDAAASSSAGERRGLGLLGMRERLNAVGGSLQFNSAPGQGTELTISVPIEV